MTTAALGFGALDIKLEEPLFGMLDPGDPWIAALAEGADWGTPEAVVASVASMLMDGSKSQITRYGNRIAVVPLRITGENLDVVADGEAIVMGEVNKGRNVFRWTPPGPSETSVFDVVYSKLDFKFDDLAEANQVTRYFTLTMECLPGARPENPITVVATAIPDTTPAVTEIDACTSLTNWSATYSTLSLAGGKILTTGVGGNHWDAQRTGLAVTVGSERFLIVELGSLPSGGFGVVFDGPIVVTPAASEPIAGGVRCYVPIPPSITTINALGIGATAGGPMKISRVAKTDQLPYVGSKKQRSFSLTIPGTARTSVDIAIESASAAVLGTDVLLYTAPDGAAASPAMRQWLTTSPTPVSSAGTVSGKYHLLNGPPSVYQRPVAVTPAGTYLMMVRVTKSGGTVSGITWTASTVGHDNYTIAETETDTVIIDVTGSYEFHPIGVVTLPPSEISPDSGASIRLQLSSSVADVRIDDLWLFNLDIGILSWAKSAGLGVVGSRFAALGASLDRENPTWVSGTAGETAQDVDISRLMESVGEHVLAPGAADVFLITTAAVDQGVAAKFYPRYQHHVPLQVP